MSEKIPEMKASVDQLREQLDTVHFRDVSPESIRSTVSQSSSAHGSVKSQIHGQSSVTQASVKSQIYGQSSGAHGSVKYQIHGQSSSAHGSVMSKNHGQSHMTHSSVKSIADNKLCVSQGSFNPKTCDGHQHHLDKPSFLKHKTSSMVAQKCKTFNKERDEKPVATVKPASDTKSNVYKLGQKVKVTENMSTLSTLNVRLGEQNDKDIPQTHKRDCFECGPVCICQETVVQNVSEDSMLNQDKSGENLDNKAESEEEIAVDPDYKEEDRNREGSNGFLEDRYLITPEKLLKFELSLKKDQLHPDSPHPAYGVNTDTSDTADSSGYLSAKMSDDVTVKTSGVAEPGDIGLSLAITTDTAAPEGSSHFDVKNPVFQEISGIGGNNSKNFNHPSCAQINKSSFTDMPEATYKQNWLRAFQNYPVIKDMEIDLPSFLNSPRSRLGGGIAKTSAKCGPVFSPVKDMFSSKDEELSVATDETDMSRKVLKYDELADNDDSIITLISNTDSNSDEILKFAQQKPLGKHDSPKGSKRVRFCINHARE